MRFTPTPNRSNFRSARSSPPFRSARSGGTRAGLYAFEGVIDGVRLEAKIEQTGSLRYTFRAEAKGANLSGITNPVQVSLGIGDDVGLTSVKAHFDRDIRTMMIRQIVGIDRGT
jgi:hypothetical protein